MDTFELKNQNSWLNQKEHPWKLVLPVWLWVYWHQKGGGWPKWNALFLSRESSCKICCCPSRDDALETTISGMSGTSSGSTPTPAGRNLKHVSAPESPEHTNRASILQLNSFSLLDGAMGVCFCLWELHHLFMWSAGGVHSVPPLNWTTVCPLSLQDRQQ